MKTYFSRGILLTAICVVSFLLAHYFPLESQVVQNEPLPERPASSVEKLAQCRDFKDHAEQEMTLSSDIKRVNNAISFFRLASRCPELDVKDGIATALEKRDELEKTQ